jgi:hypothetical protein
MNQNFAYAIGAFAGSIPYLAIVLILGHYFVRRANYQRRKKKSVPGFYPSSAALGMVFLLTQMYYRPSIQHAVEARLVIDVEEDDQGDPETPAKQLDRQLKRIRRGEQVESLILRL